MMNRESIVVQKFGGSSLQTPELRQQAISHIKKTVQNNKVLVVVSAIGRAPDPYATDTLIKLIKDINPKSSLRELDLAISCGEVISSSVIAVSLQAEGYPAIALTGSQAGIITDENYTNGCILNINTEKIEQLMDQNQIVIVTGFQGVSKNGEIVTLGRGGSDTSATAIAGELRADKVEIYTDVDGLMTVDPKMVPEAQPIKVINFYEVLQMAKEGVKVIHPKAVEYAMKYAVPIHIKNITKFTETQGTTITGQISESSFYDRNSVVTGIAHIPNIAQITLQLDYNTSQNIKVDVFNTLANENISLDMINVSNDQIVFTVKEEIVSKALELLNERGFGNLNYLTGCTKITLFGTGMTGIPGVMAKVLKLLNTEKIPVLQTTDSNITISCLIPGEHTQQALLVLHENFYLYKEGSKE